MWWLYWVARVCRKVTHYPAHNKLWCEWVRNLFALQKPQAPICHIYSITKESKYGKKKRAKTTAAEDKTGSKPGKKNLCLWHNGVRSLNTANKGASPDLCPQCGRLLPLSGQSYCCSLPTQPALMACQTWSGNFKAMHCSLVGFCVNYSMWPVGSSFTVSYLG